MSRDSEASRFPRQLRWAFLLGMAGAIVLISAIGGTERKKLHAALGSAVTAPRISRPVAPAN